MALPLITPADVEQWYAESTAVQHALEHHFTTFPAAHEVWHFFSDADIRAREVGYRERQHRIMSEYVQRLRM